jgi:hypothetical protein
MSLESFANKPIVEHADFDATTQEAISWQTAALSGLLNDSEEIDPSRITAFNNAYAKFKEREGLLAIALLQKNRFNGEQDNLMNQIQDLIDRSSAITS